MSSSKKVSNKIGFKFQKKDARVTFSGLREGERLPKGVQDVLVNSGFCASEDANVWIDRAEPKGVLKEDLVLLGTYAPITLCASIPAGKRKRAIVYSVEMGGCKKYEAVVAHKAMLSAFSAWNRADRPQGTTTLTTRLSLVLDLINSSR